MENSEQILKRRQVARETTIWKFCDFPFWNYGPERNRQTDGRWALLRSRAPYREGDITKPSSSVANADSRWLMRLPAPLRFMLLLLLQMTMLWLCSANEARRPSLTAGFPIIAPGGPLYPLAAVSVWSIVTGSRTWLAQTMPAGTAVCWRKVSLWPPRFFVAPSGQCFPVGDDGQLPSLSLTSVVVIATSLQAFYTLLIYSPQDCKFFSVRESLLFYFMIAEL